MPLVIATTLREQESQGCTRTSASSCATSTRRRPAALVTPFSWGRPLTAPGLRAPVPPPARERSRRHVVVPALARGFLRRALRHVLAGTRTSASSTRSARSRRARPSVLDAGRTNASSWPCTSGSRSPTSGWTRVSIRRDGAMYRRCRSFERDVITRVDAHGLRVGLGRGRAATRGSPRRRRFPRRSSATSSPRSRRIDPVRTVEVISSPWGISRASRTMPTSSACWQRPGVPAGRTAWTSSGRALGGTTSSG